MRPQCHTITHAECLAQWQIFQYRITLFIPLFELLSFITFTRRFC